MPIESPYFAEESGIQPPITLEADPYEDGKRGYLLYVDGVGLATLSVGNHWRSLAWHGANIFDAPQDEMLEKLLPLVPQKKKHEVYVTFTYQNDKNNKGIVALRLMPRDRKNRASYKHYKKAWKNPSDIVEIKYDIDNDFRVIAYGSGHKVQPGVAVLKVRPDAHHTPEMLEWAIDHHAGRGTLPAIDPYSSAHALAQLR